MLVRKVEKSFEFESPTVDGAFLVRLIIDKSGKESLVTMPIGSTVAFEALALKKGTIRKTIGEDRWKNFEKMKKNEMTAMFIDSNSPRSVSVSKITA